MAEQMYPGLIEIAYTPDDAVRIHNSGKLIAGIGIENGWVIGHDLSLIKTYYDLGARYIGLSIESEALNSGKITSAGDLVRLLRNLGTSVLRFGGNSGDTSFTGISPSGLRNLVATADASGWSVLYTENEGEYDPARANRDSIPSAAQTRRI